ncbi:hypothetical protein D3C81_1198060 [compost metagenome]
MQAGHRVNRARQCGGQRVGANRKRRAVAEKIRHHGTPALHRHTVTDDGDKTTGGHFFAQRHGQCRIHIGDLHQIHRCERVQPLQQAIEALRMRGVHQHGDAEPRHLLGQHLAQLQATDVRGEDQSTLTTGDLLKHQFALQLDAIGRVATAQAEELVQQRVGEGEEMAQAVAATRRPAQHPGMRLQPLQILQRGASCHAIAQPMTEHHRPDAQAERPAPEPAVHRAQEQHAGHRGGLADIGPMRRRPCSSHHAGFRRRCHSRRGARHNTPKNKRACMQLMRTLSRHTSKCDTPSDG